MEIRTTQHFFVEQIAFVEYTDVDELEPGPQPDLSMRPGVGRALQRLLTIGGPQREVRRRSRYRKGGKMGSKQQFKIEPLLNRDAPPVEVSNRVLVE